MSSPATMYALQPIVVLPDACPRTKTMYEMRNIHEDESRKSGRLCRHDANADAKMPDVTEQVIRLLKSPLPEFSALEARQEKILNQLAELKKQVSTLCRFLKQSHQDETRKDCTLQETGVNVNLVVNANPKRPPYSILALQKLWKDTDIRVTSYIHSTVVGQTPVYPINTHSTGNNIVNLTLIWKEVDGLEISDLHNYSIVGEGNFLRYISRLIHAHNYENVKSFVQLHVIDEILDLCHCAHYQVSPNKVQQALSAITNKLEKTQWTGESEPSIADIAAWSTFKQLSPKKIPSCLNKWYGMCEKTFL